LKPLGGHQVISKQEKKKTKWPPNGPSQSNVKTTWWPPSLQVKKSTTWWPLDLQMKKKTSWPPHHLQVKKKTKKRPSGHQVKPQSSVLKQLGGHTNRKPLLLQLHFELHFDYKT